MKNIVLLFILAITSCYTKNQAIEKFCNKDTIQVTTVIHDTIIIDSIQVDTVFNESVDSVYLVKDKIEIRYIKKYGKIYLEGKCKGDTVFYTKEVFINAPVLTKKLPWYKQLGADYWFILPLILLILILVSLIRKWLNTQ
jgi:hypothetical protein